MELATIIVGVLLTYFTGYRPWAKARRYSQQKKFERSFRNIQLITLRNAYPSLQQLERAEIEQRYNVDKLYWGLSFRD